MRAVVNCGIGSLELRELPLPEPGPGQVRIKVAVCGVCASDLEMVDGWSRAKYPVVLGHEWAGHVDACGPAVDASLLGRPCVADNVLADGGEVGFEHPGGYGEYLLTEAKNLLTLPDGFPLDEAALLEPLAVVTRGLSRLQPAPGPALVFGDGTIGLLAAALLREAGAAPVVMVGGREPRLRLARDFGVDKTVNYHEAGDALAEAVEAAFPGRFQSFVEATSSDKNLELVPQLGANDAKILLMGNYPDKRASLDLQSFLHQEFLLVGSNASAGAWPAAVATAASRRLPLAKLATHRFAVEDFATALETARRAKDVVKALLCWDKKLLEVKP